MAQNTADRIDHLKQTINEASALNKVKVRKTLHRYESDALLACPARTEHVKRDMYHAAIEEYYQKHKHLVELSRSEFTGELQLDLNLHIFSPEELDKLILEVRKACYGFVVDSVEHDI